MSDKRVRNEAPPRFQRRVLVIAAGLLTLCAFPLATASQGNESPTEDEDRYNLFRNAVEEKTVTAGGAIFTRWGRTSCPSDSLLVYAGVTGGAHYKHPGSGSNYVCLPRDPVFDSVIQTAYRALMYGTEYRAIDGVFKKPLHAHDAPCAVCKTSRRMHQLMIPGRNMCYPGWHAEYNGYLVAARYDHAGRTEFVCLDAYPEKDQDGHRDDLGALMYIVEGVCGSLPCPPYSNNKPLTCVVCTM